MAAAEEQIPRKGRRKRRCVRARTIPVKRMTKEQLRIGRILYPETNHWRPGIRGECPAERPCPFVSCRYNLYLDVDPRTGSIKLNFPDIEPRKMVESCVLDVADRDGVTLDDVGEFMNLTRERIRQVELMGIEKLRKGQDRYSLSDYR